MPEKNERKTVILGFCRIFSGWVPCAILSWRAPRIDHFHIPEERDSVEAKLGRLFERYFDSRRYIFSKRFADRQGDQILKIYEVPLNFEKIEEALRLLRFFMALEGVA